MKTEWKEVVCSSGWMFKNNLIFWFVHSISSSSWGPNSSIFPRGLPSEETCCCPTSLSPPQVSLQCEQDLSDTSPLAHHWSSPRQGGSDSSRQAPAPAASVSPESFGHLKNVQHSTTSSVNLTNNSWHANWIFFFFFFLLRDEKKVQVISRL